MFLCGLLVEAHSGTVITADVKDPEFHAVIFGNDDNAVSDMTTEELQQARGTSFTARVLCQFVGTIRIECQDRLRSAP